MSPFELGATLYVPATHNDLLRVLCGERYPQLRSVVCCLEDAVAERDVDSALSNLRSVSQNMGACKPGLLRFIRPRNIAMAKMLAQDATLSGFSGLVLPKFNLADLPAWEEALRDRPEWQLMPTLECHETFDLVKMRALVEAIGARSDFAQRILTFRIGGNDLMQQLSLRRDRTRTLYEGPLSALISGLVSVFHPAGYALSAPVCEIIDEPGLLSREAEMDVAHGLVGKTAIHPQQVAVIHQSWMVDRAEYDEAKAILSPDAKAVFRSRGAMCEVATHSRWAKNILARAEIYGIRGDHPLREIA